MVTASLNVFSAGKQTQMEATESSKVKRNEAIRRRRRREQNRRAARKCREKKKESVDNMLNVTISHCSIDHQKVNEPIAVHGFPSHSCGTSLAIWDHALTPASKLVHDLPTPEGWKAELT